MFKVYFYTKFRMSHFSGPLFVATKLKAKEHSFMAATLLFYIMQIFTLKVENVSVVSYYFTMLNSLVLVSLPPNNFAQCTAYLEI
jgi:hypothetical protein